MHCFGEEERFGEYVDVGLSTRDGQGVVVNDMRMVCALNRVYSIVMVNETLKREVKRQPEPKSQPATGPARYVIRPNQGRAGVEVHTDVLGVGIRSDHISYRMRERVYRGKRSCEHVIDVDVSVEVDVGGLRAAKRRRSTSAGKVD